VYDRRRSNEISNSTYVYAIWYFGVYTRSWPNKIQHRFRHERIRRRGQHVKKFYEILTQLENKVIEAVSEQSEDIFGKKMSIDELKPMFNSNVKESPDREPKFRVKVDSTIDGKVKSHVYDENKNPLYDDIQNGLYARQSGTAVVEMNSVYFLNRKFGISWKLNSLVVYEPQRLKGFQFIGV
jgi:hypothetical protein